MTQPSRDAWFRAGAIATVVIALLIAGLTLAPVPHVEAPGSDKAHHLIAFAALSFPLSAARPRLAPWVILFAVVYGGAIELVQPFAGRQAEWGDVVANTVGAALGAAAGALVAPLVQRWLAITR